MEFLSSDLFYAVAGTFLGFLSGLIPGVGNVVMLLITYPLLIDASLFQMLLFYLAIISSIIVMAKVKSIFTHNI